MRVCQGVTDDGVTDEGRVMMSEKGVKEAGQKDTRMIGCDRMRVCFVR